MLKQFLEEVLPRVTAQAHARGLDLDMDLDGDFRDVAMRLKDEKLKVRLCQWIEKRTALLAGLENLKIIKN